MAIVERTFCLCGAERAGRATVRCHDTAVPPRAIMQVVPRSSDHARRYRKTLQPLLARGWVIYVHDERNGPRGGAGQESAQRTGEDHTGPALAELREVGALARKQYPGLPLVLMGHGLGSLFAQAYVLDDSAMIDGLILAGPTAFCAGVDPLPPARLWPHLRGSSHAGPPQGQHSTPGLNPHASRRASGTLEPMSALAYLSERVEDPLEIARIRKNLPIYAFAGSQDPLTEGIERLWPVIERYCAAGIQSLELKIYPGTSQELLEEPHRREVLGDLTAWLEDTVTGPTRCSPRRIRSPLPGRRLDLSAEDLT